MTCDRPLQSLRLPFAHFAVKKILNAKDAEKDRKDRKEKEHFHASYICLDNRFDLRGGFVRYFKWEEMRTGKKMKVDWEILLHETQACKPRFP